MINLITLVQQYLECCESLNIKGTTPESFILTLDNEDACVFLMDYMLSGGYSEESIENFIQELNKTQVESFMVELCEVWKQLTL